MEKTKYNQKGQSPLLVIAILALVLIVGFTVWRLMNVDKDNSVSKPTTKVTELESRDISKQKQKFSQATLDYFEEVALGSEFNDSGPKVAKWEKSKVELKVNGTPSASDAICLDQVVADFNEISTETKLSVTKNSSVNNIYFAPVAEFKTISPSYVPNNMGYFSVNWQERSITNVSILISTTGLTDVEKCHLIREETTQSMGIMKDSHSYSDSIFYDDWSYVNAYSDIDKQVIKLLYGGNDIKPNDDITTVKSKVTIY